MSGTIYNAMKSPPCKNCDRREVGCHGRCELYREFTERHKSEKSQKLQENNVTSYFIESARRGIKKARRR